MPVHFVINHSYVRRACVITRWFSTLPAAKLDSVVTDVIVASHRNKLSRHTRKIPGEGCSQGS